MHRCGREADFFKQRGQRIAFGNDHFPVTWSLLFFDHRRGLSGFLLFLRFFGTVFDLRKRGDYRLICGLSGVSSVLVL
ncbi:hypothetical protein D3C84_1228900 [compost metagenome]